MAEKFRSLKAFHNFEQRTLGQQAQEAQLADVSPLRVLSQLRAHPGGIARVALSAELGASEQAVDAALRQLLREKLVRIEPGDAGIELVFVS